jgi:ribosomal protein S18 acetylase RimI-like enzyme
MIERITSDRQLEETVQVIRESFRTVAGDFGLTEENCPTNPAFMTLDRLNSLIEKGSVCYGLYADTGQIGAVALEKLNEAEYAMERLAVLPEHRHRGSGEQLVEFACATARDAGAGRIVIGIIDENTVLKGWYLRLGFIETGTRRFDHLPFTVCFMRRDL